MPNRNGTGPKGEGPQTGRQQGNCQRNESSNANSREFNGRRQGCRKTQGFGKGRGLGCRRNN